MDVFKISVDTQQVHKITQENFDLATKKQAPWYQPINGHQGWFAVCPACDNPVQIIGMLDRVIYLLEKCIGMRISDAQAKLMLESYRLAEGWRYRGATRQNIPWTFAYMMQASRVWGRFFYDFELVDELCARRPDLTFNEDRKTRRIAVKEGAAFCDLTFSLIKHSRHLDSHTLSESIEFNIADSEQKTIYKKRIDFDYDFFLRLINSKNEAHRKMHLVDLARSILV